MGIAGGRGDGNRGSQMWTWGAKGDMLVAEPRQDMAEPVDQVGGHAASVVMEATIGKCCSRGVYRGWSPGPLPHLGSKWVDGSVGKQGGETVNWDMVRRVRAILN